MKPQTQALPGDSLAAGKGAKPLKQELLHERCGKQYYSSDRPDFLIQEFMPNGSGSNGATQTDKNQRSRDVRSLRNEISAYLFEYLEGFHVPTHYVTRLSNSEMVVKRLEMIPLTVHLFNQSNPGLQKRLGIAPSQMLEFPIVEHYYQSHGKAATWVNEYHTAALGIASPYEMKQINRIASKVNAVLRGLADRRQFRLAELQLQFGRYHGQVYLGDELSPYTCQFIDLSLDNADQQERFLPGRPDAEETFAELCDRLKLRL